METRSNILCVVEFYNAWISCTELLVLLPRADAAWRSSTRWFRLPIFDRFREGSNYHRHYSLGTYLMRVLGLIYTNKRAMGLTDDRTKDK